MIDWWGPCIHEYYGSTEGSVVTGISAQEWLQRPASVGRATFQTDVLHPARRRQRGAARRAGHDLHAQPPRHRRARTTTTRPRPRPRTAEQGLFTTGDVGWIDAEGYLYLTDRKIDMIISGGVNIYPAEIEAVLAEHPAVQDVAVIGVPNAEFGEEVKAIVQATADRRAGTRPRGHADAPLPREARRLQGAAFDRVPRRRCRAPRRASFRSGCCATRTGRESNGGSEMKPRRRLTARPRGARRPASFRRVAATPTRRGDRYAAVSPSRPSRKSFSAR